jgi:hypothetical protein
VVFVAFGADAERSASLARRAGLSARVASLDGRWREATRLTLAG